MVLGGASVSFTEAGQLETLFPGIDYFIRGYAENALTKLVESAGRVTATGVHIAGRRDQREFATVDMATLASPYLGTQPIPIGPDGFLWWETVRGCPFRCAFCQHSGPGPAGACAQMPISRLQQEIEAFATAGVRDIKIIDPCFNFPHSHHLAVLSLLARLPTLERLVMEARFEYVEERFVSQVACLGGELEFGIQTIVPMEEEAIRRSNNQQKIQEAVRLLHRYDAGFTISLIYGLPHQTPASFQQTIDYAQSLEPTAINAFPLALYRGSRLERDREVWELTVKDKGLPLVISSNSFTREDYQHMEEMAQSLR